MFNLEYLLLRIKHFRKYNAGKSEVILSPLIKMIVDSWVFEGLF